MQSEPNTDPKPFRIDVADRVKRLPPYLFGKINDLKYRKRRAGIDVIDLGMGNPTDVPDQFIIDKLCEAARDDKAHRYAMANGLPNLRRNVCPHFYVTGTRGALPIHAPHLLKGIVRQESVISRCQLRGGVHLEQSYVNDVCLSPRFNQCVFYEDELSRE